MEQAKPVGLEQPYVPPKVNVTEVPTPRMTLGELLVWKGWHWVVVEANAKGQVLLQLREASTTAISRKLLEGKRVTRHLKKLRKRERVFSLKQHLEEGKKK
ncbi:hypothetical protein LCGC14_2704560 [marine sediment metagenome]|uniref:Uncharacterized protein n=1 Tax=marine sediment metagenome TaxID=412755 RepID=A0A0F9C6J5_9ZZZZ